MSRISFFSRSLAVVVVGFALAGCADPEPGGPNSSGSGRAGEGGVSSNGSVVTSTWGLQPVEEVVALVPDEYKDQTLDNGIYNDYPPEMFLEGDTLVGIQPDIALALSEVMGLKFNNISVGSFDSLIPGVVSGRYDLSSADFGVTKERLEQVDFVTEFALGTGFAVKEGSDITIDDASDLCGHSVGVIAGSYFIEQVDVINDECTAAGNEAIDLKTFPNDGARTLALTNGRIEVTAASVDALGYQVQSQNVPIELQDFQYEPVEQAIVMPDGSDLGPAMQAAMQEIINNGTYAKILDKWGVSDVAYDSADQVQLLTEPEQAP